MCTKQVAVTNQPRRCQSQSTSSCIAPTWLKDELGAELNISAVAIRFYALRGAQQRTGDQRGALADRVEGAELHRVGRHFAADGDSGTASSFQGTASGGSTVCWSEAKEGSSEVGRSIKGLGRATKGDYKHRLQFARRLCPRLTVVHSCLQFASGRVPVECGTCLVYSSPGPCSLTFQLLAGAQD